MPTRAWPGPGPSSPWCWCSACCPWWACPPLAGFGAKLLLFGAAVDAGLAWLAVVAVVNSVISLAYYLRVLAPSYFEPLAGPVPVLGSWAGLATLVCGAGVVALGIAAEPLLEPLSVARLLPG